MTTGAWTLDLTGYLIGIPMLLYGVFAKRFRGRSMSFGRAALIGLGCVGIVGNIAQNIIEFRNL